MDTRKIEQLAQILRQNRLTKLELTEGDTTLLLEAAIAPAAAPAEDAEPVVRRVPVFQTETAAAEPLPEVQPPSSAATAQTCPLVGTVYLAPQAGAEPFVKVGDKVKKGDVLCIVESMKMFNNIEAEFGGTIEEICVDNGQIVEFGQPLVRILAE